MLCIILKLYCLISEEKKIQFEAIPPKKEAINLEKPRLSSEKR